MSTTTIYGFNFLIPIALKGVPIEFEAFKKEDGTFHTYDTYMQLPNNEAFSTPSGTHALLGMNITSTKIRMKLEAQLSAFNTAYGTNYEMLDGEDIDRWADADQSNYIWIVSTDPKAVGYNWEAFKLGNTVLFGGAL